MERLEIRPRSTRINKAPLIVGMVVIGIAGYFAVLFMQTAPLAVSSAPVERAVSPVLPYAKAENVSVEVPVAPTVPPVVQPTMPVQAAVATPSLRVDSERVQTLRVFGLQVFRYASMVEGNRP